MSNGSQCDGIDNCGDYSDEANCPCPTQDMFRFGKKKSAAKQLKGAAVRGAAVRGAAVRGAAVRGAAVWKQL